VSLLSGSGSAAVTVLDVNYRVLESVRVSTYHRLCRILEILYVFRPCWRASSVTRTNAVVSSDCTAVGSVARMSTLSYLNHDQFVAWASKSSFELLRSLCNYKTFFLANF